MFPAQLLRWVQLRLHLYFSKVYIAPRPGTVTLPDLDDLISSVLLPRTSSSSDDTISTSASTLASLLSALTNSTTSSTPVCPLPPQTSVVLQLSVKNAHVN